MILIALLGVIVVFPLIRRVIIIIFYLGGFLALFIYLRLFSLRKPTRPFLFISHLVITSVALVGGLAFEDLSSYYRLTLTLSSPTTITVLLALLTAILIVVGFYLNKIEGLRGF